jgi:hypothetical protein
MFNEHVPWSWLDYAQTPRNYALGIKYDFLITLLLITL